MSSLAAPSFAAAALGDPILGSFTLGGALYVIGRLVVETGAPLDGTTLSTLSQRFDLAVLGGEEAGAGGLLEELSESRLTAGTSVVVIGAKRNWDRASVGGESRRARQRVRPHQRVRTRSHAASLFHLPIEIWRGSPAPL